MPWAPAAGAAIKWAASACRCRVIMHQVPPAECPARLTSRHFDACPAPPGPLGIPDRVLGTIQHGSAHKSARSMGCPPPLTHGTACTTPCSSWRAERGAWQARAAVWLLAANRGSTAGLPAWRVRRPAARGWQRALRHGNQGFSLMSSASGCGHVRTEGRKRRVRMKIRGALEATGTGLPWGGPIQAQCSTSGVPWHREKEV